MNTLPRDIAPPHNLEAERAILGALLLNWEVLPQAQEILGGPCDFFEDLHGQIYRAIIAVYSAAEAGEYGRSDILPVLDSLSDGKRLSRAGWGELLGSMMDACPTTENIRYHCSVVHKSALARRAIAEAERLRDSLYCDGDNPLATLSAGSLRIQTLLEEIERGSHRPLVLSSADLARMKPEPAKSLWGEPGASILSKSAVTILHSREGLGKSWLVSGLVHAIATGAEEFLGVSCYGPENVLVISAELPDSELWRRDELTRGEDVPDKNVYWMSEEGLVEFGRFDLREASTVARLTRLAIGLNAGVIIMDPLANLFRGKEDNESFADIIESFRQIRVRTGAALLVLAHEPKVSGADKVRELEDSNSLRGGTVLPAGVKSVLRLKEKQGHAQLVHWKSNLGRKHDPIWLDLECRWRPRVIQAPDDSAVRKEHALREIVAALEANGKPMSAGMLLETTGLNITDRTLRRYMSELSKAGAVEVTGKGAGCRYGTSDRGE